MKVVNKKVSGILTVLVLSSCVLFLNVCSVFAVEAGGAQEKALQKLKVEITEVEELKDPVGAAIYTVRDLASGKTMRLFVDPFRSLIQSGGKSVGAGDVLGGSKATIIYQDSPSRDIPEVVFARITSSYYS